MKNYKIEKVNNRKPNILGEIKINLSFSIITLS